MPMRSGYILCPKTSALVASVIEEVALAAISAPGITQVKNNIGDGSEYRAAIESGKCVWFEYRGSSFSSVGGTFFVPALKFSYGLAGFLYVALTFSLGNSGTELNLFVTYVS